MVERRLSDLLGLTSDAASVMIKGITTDSRAVKRGDLFVALPGVNVDGRDFIDAAVSKGAAAVLSTKGAVVPGGRVPLIEVSNPRREYADLSANFYQGQPEHMVAVTGTNGKTSVAEFTRQLWAQLRLTSASLGTLGVRSAPVERPGGLTTPDPMALHAALYDLAKAGVTHAALEASSHGLDQYRLDGVNLQAAGFTNLTRDHLDYHGTEISYLFAKARLFGELLSPDATAVINIDAPYGREVDDLTWGRGLKRITVGRSEKATLQIIDVVPSVGAQALTVLADGKTHKITIPLIGSFQAENAVLAAGLVMATGYSAEEVLPHIAKLKGVPGRMEFMGKTVSGGAVYVDYAHTPNGMETALKAARAHNPSKISIVFGCGGNRDKGKRPEMGKVAADGADNVIITDDNPRYEDAATIRSEVLAACPDALEIADRKEAIAKAINDLKKDEILMITGKGHELGQTVGDNILPHSDLAEVTRILSDQRRGVSDA